MLTVRITGIAAGGAGVGRDHAGRAVFVHRTAPGELVEARVSNEKSRWAQARLLRVLEASPERRSAPCRFYDRCGGCTLEHIEYPAQLAAKARIVADGLRRIGGIDTPVPDVVPSPREFRYRNRVSFTLLRLPSGGVVAGFHELARPDRVIDIDDACLLPEPAVAETWRAVRAQWGRDASRLPSGPQLRLTLRATMRGSTALLVEGGYSEGRPGELLALVPALEAIWHQRGAGGQPVLLAGAAVLAESWQDETVSLGGAVFLQVNRFAAELLEEHVLALAGDVSGLSVVDAYCGVGLHARRLARAGARVAGIELDTLAAAEARRAAPGVQFVVDRVETALPSLLPADLVLLNPPRAGLDVGTVAALHAQPPARVIYISCDAATLARDLSRLGPMFTVRSISCFDLFPQTAHVESVVELACSTT